MADTYLTTGAVAKALGLCPRTIAKMFDDGHLAGYKIPGSKFRRISRQSVIDFCNQSRIDLPEAFTQDLPKPG